ncbi:MAG: GNAT family N-acetyltransferase [Azospira oryzae]|jgi:ribosomal protein S18 acetylase RimI-like enzyme|nr:MAG: GNAT family N-acetyltransferase [Azospira oryzae]
MNTHSKLDNPVWYALTETHRDFAVVADGVKFYHPDYCPFGGFTASDKTIPAIESYSKQIADFYIVGEKPAFNTSVMLTRERVCNQMVIEQKVDIQIHEEIIELKEEHSASLFQLVNRVQPGYFKKETRRLGSYFGIMKDGQLLAVTGERMKMDAYTEVSAVVTDPEHTGKGLASQLVAFTVNRILAENKTPLLHVVESNTKAIRLYEKLGFMTRRKISLWNLVRVDTNE